MGSPDSSLSCRESWFYGGWSAYKGGEKRIIEGLNLAQKYSNYYYQ